MTLRYVKWKDGVKHYYYLGNIAQIKVVTARSLEVTINSGMVSDVYIIDGVEHTINKFINTPQHFIIEDTDTRKHLRLYL